MSIEDENKKNKEIEDSLAEEAPVEEVAAEEAPVEEVAVDEAAVEEVSRESVDLDFIIGKKLGMTTIYGDSGVSLPVTVIEAGPCKITQIKSIDIDGYSALQIGFLASKKTTKSISGHLKNANVDTPLKVFKEFKCEKPDSSFLGKEVTVDSFSLGDLVNVSGKSKGKGFAGHMKRHNFAGGRASHGKNSVMRKAGSVGAGTWPGRVWPGTRMAGRMGGNNVTVENLKVLKIDSENNLLFVKGAVPGPSKSILFIEK